MKNDAKGSDGAGPNRDTTGAGGSADGGRDLLIPFDVLCCPVTGSPLSIETDDRGRLWLVSERGQLRYPIVGGIPMLTPQAARLPEGCSSVEDAVTAHPG